MMKSEIERSWWPRVAAKGHDACSWATAAICSLRRKKKMKGRERKMDVYIKELF